MLARAHAFTIDGFQTRHVTVEVDVRAGLPAFVIVGLADTAVREARERLGAAIRNSGFDFPARRITANLAPADVPKSGPGLDLALACALLAASGQISPRFFEEVALVGELGLDGRLRPARGTLAIAEAAGRAGLRTLSLAPESAPEAALVGGIRIAPAACLCCGWNRVGEIAGRELRFAGASQRAAWSCRDAPTELINAPASAVQPTFPI